MRPMIRMRYGLEHDTDAVAIIVRIDHYYRALPRFGVGHQLRVEALIAAGMAEPQGFAFTFKKHA